MPSFRILPGLPPHNAAAVPFPADWGRCAREGFVVEFLTDTGESWVGNFRPGLGGVDDVRPHPNGRDVLVTAAGSVWIVDRNRRECAEDAGAIDAIWPVSDPDGIVMSRQGLALIRLGAEGRLWHTRRISWDGFKDVQISWSEISGLAWAPWTPEWTRFTVDLRTGRVQGGSYTGPDEVEWESLATERSA